MLGKLSYFKCVVKYSQHQNTGLRCTSLMLKLTTLCPEKNDVLQLCLITIAMSNYSATH